MLRSSLRRMSRFSGGGTFAPTASRSMFSGIFSGGSSAAEQQKKQKAPPANDTIFEHWDIVQQERESPSGFRDPVIRALLVGGAYVDERVVWLPYKQSELTRRSATTLGVPLRMSSLTVTEPVGQGVLLACLPLDLCVSPGFIEQTPALIKCFENINKDGYSATVGDATFELDYDAVCSIVLLSFAITTEGPLQDYFRAIIDVENLEARWQLFDVTSTTGDGDEPEALSAVDNKTLLSPFMEQLCECLPQDNERESWKFFAQLCAARTQVVRALFADMYLREGSVFFEGCSFQDFCACVSVFQSRSAPIISHLQNALRCQVGVLPFYDCADHRPMTTEQEREVQRQQEQLEKDGDANLKLKQEPTGTVAVPGDMLALRYFVPAPPGQRSCGNNDEAPSFLPQAIRMKPSVGVFAAQDLVPGQPVTRCFGTESPRGTPSEENLFWMINHGSAPWAPKPEGKK